MQKLLLNFYLLFVFHLILESKKSGREGCEAALDGALQERYCHTIIGHWDAGILRFAQTGEHFPAVYHTTTAMQDQLILC